MRFNLTVGKLSFSVLGRLAKLSWNDEDVLLKCGSKFILTNKDLKNGIS